MFVEWKMAYCRECGTFLAHSWNPSSGRTVKGSLCTACVAPHIRTGGEIAASLIRFPD